MRPLTSSITAACALLALIAVSPDAAQAQEGASCAPLTWTTLGTAGGPMPTPDRAEPSNLLRAGDKMMLVDAGDGTVNQLAKIGINLGRIDAVFISHHHLDHTGGLGAVIGLRWMTNFPGQLTVYGPPGTRELVAGITASMQPQARIGFGVGAATPPPEGSVRVVELQDGQQVQHGAVTAAAAANTHFNNERSDKQPISISLSYRFNLGNRSITYSGDTAPSAAITKLATSSDLLMTEIMNYEALIAEIAQQRPDMPAQVRRQIEKHLFTHHLTPEQVGEMAAKAGVKQVLLTHYSIPQGPLAASSERLVGGVRTLFRGPIQLGRDLGSIDLGCN